tara:strand:+ start:44 stop:493 length:450 start_codon:yes stop_codon:yes gene_type:complete
MAKDSVLTSLSDKISKAIENKDFDRLDGLLDFREEYEKAAAEREAKAEKEAKDAKAKAKTYPNVKSFVKAEAKAKAEREAEAKANKPTNYAEELREAMAKPRFSKGGIKKKKTKPSKRPEMMGGGMYKSKKHSYAAGGMVKDMKIMRSK